ncbi:MAG: hypothetical protein QOE64_1223 [Frankiales bacterium]|nr:hypothetical protein [Frankiales bacterium]
MGSGDRSRFGYPFSGPPLGELTDSFVQGVLGPGPVAPPGGHPPSSRPPLSGQGDSASGDGSTRDPGDRPVSVVHGFTNDQVNNAYAVPSLPFRARTDTSSATREPSEPADCFPTGGTAWYRFTPLRDAALVADTFGTGRPTALAVYTRSTDGAWKNLGCDQNGAGNAQVAFSMRAGTSYYLQLTATVRGGPTVFELAAVGPTDIASGAPNGAPADGPAYNYADISANGRYVAFFSFAHNLSDRVPECAFATSCESVYLRDRWTGRTDLLVSVKTSSPPATDGGSYRRLITPSVSDDGRYVVFAAIGGNQDLTPEDQVLVVHAYRYDRVRRRLDLVSRASDGSPASGSTESFAAEDPVISGDGRYLVFSSPSDNLGGPSGEVSVYMRDLRMGITRLISTNEEGKPLQTWSHACGGRSVSRDGRFVAFMTDTANNGGGELAPTPRVVRLWDRRTNTSRQVTPDSGPGMKGASCPAISAAGGHVVFTTADALVPQDTNGTPDVYEYTVKSARLVRVSVTSEGGQTTEPNNSTDSPGGCDCISPQDTPVTKAVTVSADGRYVAFDSAAAELTGDSIGSSPATAGTADPRQVFVHDLLTGATVRASLSSTGKALSGNGTLPYISADGRYVAFFNTPRTGTGAPTQADVFVHRLR